MKYQERRDALVKHCNMSASAARAAARLDCLRAARIGMVPLETVSSTMVGAIEMACNRGAPLSIASHLSAIMDAWPDTTTERVALEYVPRTRDYHHHTYPGLYVRVKIPSLDYPWDMTTEAKILSPFKTKVVMGPTVRVRGMVRSPDDTSRWIHRTIYLSEL